MDTSPPEIELCQKCRAGIIFYRAAEVHGKSLPYCSKCGDRRPGIRYVRSDLDENPSGSHCQSDRHGEERAR